MSHRNKYRANLKRKLKLFSIFCMATFVVGNIYPILMYIEYDINVYRPKVSDYVLSRLDWFIHFYILKQSNVIYVFSVICGWGVCPAQPSLSFSSGLASSSGILPEDRISPNQWTWIQSTLSRLFRTQFQYAPQVDPVRGGDVEALPCTCWPCTPSWGPVAGSTPTAIATTILNYLTITLALVTLQQNHWDQLCFGAQSLKCYLYLLCFVVVSVEHRLSRWYFTILST